MMTEKNPDQSRWYIPAASLFLYLIACILPCLEFRNHTVQIYYGYSILFLGWMAIVVGQIAWLANPLWLLSMAFFVFRRWTLSLTFSAISILFAASTFLLYRQQLPDADGSGVKIQLTSLRVGFYVWLTSLAVTGAGAIYIRMIDPDNRNR